ncbi:GspE/PulE family protein [Neoaquamicrobium sediminum]|uniref:GspE/PulE family protein n=1 Tax=Neoaquamicrobium sediminum TaxID=1849104 RepID=UPI0015650982|nr:GspE/PulE family protein [Mesorhizobium sediminum]NRC55992.1 type II/IV secretion system protein [Mesorhizobium sediminum]
MNIHDPALQGRAMLEAIADAGLAGLGAMDRVIGAGGVTRASDLHRLVDAQLVDADALAAFLASRYGVRLLDGAALEDMEIAASDLSHRFLVDNWLLPLRGADGTRLVGALHPGDHEPLDALFAVLDEHAELCVVSAPDMEARLERLADAQAPEGVAEASLSSEEAIADLRDMASGAPVVMAVDDIFRRAVDLRATDIHLEPMRGRLVLRFRIDGVLRVMTPPAADMGEPIVSRVKVLAGLDIAERRRPQDGGMRLKVRDRDIEMRVATLPSIHGETLVMRILQRDGALVDLGSIGLRGRDMETLHRLLEHTHGMIVVAGPTGSGKTTTLAAALSRLNDPGRKIVTIEDPVEYQIPGIVQSQVQPAIDLTFSSAIRAFVRQDPDIILVGEVRDPETARAAVQAGLTGHLVLTTVHANTAAAAFTRLRDLGIENYLLVGAVRGVVAQRLVRRLCEHCKRPSTIAPDLLAGDPRYSAVGFSAGDQVFEAVGCARCADAGYRGRIAVFEILTLGEEVVHLTSEGGDNARIEAAALRGGMTTMADDAVGKALDGLTSPSEVVRVTALR